MTNVSSAKLTFLNTKILQTKINTKIITILRFLSRLFTFKYRSKKINQRRLYVSRIAVHQILTYVCFFRMWIASIISICQLSFTSSTSFIWDMSIWWLLSIRCFATLDLSWFPLLNCSYAHWISFRCFLLFFHSTLHRFRFSST